VYTQHCNVGSFSTIQLVDDKSMFCVMAGFYGRNKLLLQFDKNKLLPIICSENSAVVTFAGFLTLHIAVDT
jgi:hypothetical protein